MNDKKMVFNFSRQKDFAFDQQCSAYEGGLVFPNLCFSAEQEAHICNMYTKIRKKIIYINKNICYLNVGLEKCLAHFLKIVVL